MSHSLAVATEAGTAELPILATPAAVAAHVAHLREQGRTVALVPTMGALHAGHASLLEEAGRHADAVIASVFVNPLQFAPGEDYERYPRTLAADAELLSRVGAEAVFAPSPEAMYPTGPNTVVIEPGPVGHTFEGRIRPIHFSGALTVVNKLLNIVRPDVAVFGEKDAQQLFLIRQMVAQLNLPVRIIGVPIVREPDGLARSSRNRYLSPAERASALVLFRILERAREASAAGVPEVLQIAQSAIAADDVAELDYASVVSEQTFQPVPDDFQGQARLLLAARFGGTRLIDNALLQLSPHGGAR